MLVFEALWGEDGMREDGAKTKAAGRVDGFVFLLFFFFSILVVGCCCCWWGWWGLGGMIRDFSAFSMQFLCSASQELVHRDAVERFRVLDLDLFSPMEFWLGPPRSIKLFSGSDPLVKFSQ